MNPVARVIAGRSIRVASWTHRGREEIQLPRAGVVPYEVEGPGAGGDALPVADPPGAVLPAGGGRRVAWVEGSGGDPHGRAETKLPGRREEQDFVDTAVRQAEGGDRDPARAVDREVWLEVGHTVVGSRA